MRVLPRVVGCGIGWGYGLGIWWLGLLGACIGRMSIRPFVVECFECVFLGCLVEGLGCYLHPYVPLA